MMLDAGSTSRDGGTTVWRIDDDSGEAIKEFFVTPVGRSTVLLDITVLCGDALTEDQLQQVEDEMRDRIPLREFAWHRHEMQLPAPTSL